MANATSADISQILLSINYHIKKNCSYISTTYMIHVINTKCGNFLLIRQERKKAYAHNIYGKTGRNQLYRIIDLRQTNDDFCSRLHIIISPYRHKSRLLCVSRWLSDIVSMIASQWKSNGPPSEPSELCNNETPRHGRRI